MHSEQFFSGGADPGEVEVQLARVGATRTTTAT